MINIQLGINPTADSLGMSWGQFNAIKHNCRLCMDCGHIPMCYFTMEEREIVEQICDNLYQDFCR